MHQCLQQLMLYIVVRLKLQGEAQEGVYMESLHDLEFYSAFSSPLIMLEILQFFK